MPSLNKVMIIGNVGREVEMRFTTDGKPVSTFSVATNRVWTTPDGEKKEEVEWFNIVCWNRLAETVNQYVQKGMLVYCEGRQQTRTWEGQDGQMKYRTELVANLVTFLSKVGERTESPEDDAGPGAEAPDDIPF